MADAEGRTFEGVHERLSQIVDEVSAEDISLDDALKLYEEAVKLGLSACDLSEQDIEAHLAAAEGEPGADVAAEGENATGGEDVAGDETAPAAGATAGAGASAEPSASDAEAPEPTGELS